MRRVWIIAIAGIALAGCLGDTATKAATSSTLATTTTTPYDRAVAACKKAAPGRWMNAKATTVGAIHAIVFDIGRPQKAHPFGWILKGLGPGDFAAWCWRRTGPKSFAGMVVGPHGEVVDTGQGTEGDTTPPEPGPMAVS